MENKRTQAARSASSRAALVVAARPLFAARGFADVGTDELARAAGVSRGALYHQFDGKVGLFAAVYEQVEFEVKESIAATLVASGGDPLAAVHEAVDAWLDACARPEIHRILLIEAPAVLGWERWREIGREYSVGLVEGAISSLIDAGRVPLQPVRPLAHVLIGALEEGALFAARAEDRVAATAEVRAVLIRMIDGLAGAGGAAVDQ